MLPLHERPKLSISMYIPMELSTLLSYASTFEKQAQCILAPGQSTMSKDEARKIAQNVLKALSEIDSYLLANYEYQNLLDAMKEVVSKGTVDQGLLNAAIQEAGPNGVGVFSTIQPFVKDIQRMKCIL